MIEEHGHGTGKSSPFEELIKLQNTFQQSLSQATMNYLRQLQSLVGPVTPGTVVQRPDNGVLMIELFPGGQAKTNIRAENRQRVHTMISPMLSPLTSDTGTTWFPESAFSPPTALLATDETQVFDLFLTAPKDIPIGVYRGAVLLYGCIDGVIPVEVAIREKPGVKPARRQDREAKAASRPRKRTRAPGTAKSPAGKRSPARKPSNKK